jgi:hypothetical protein
MLVCAGRLTANHASIIKQSNIKGPLSLKLAVFYVPRYRAMGQQHRIRDVRRLTSDATRLNHGVH